MKNYHCLRVSDEVFERLLKRDPDPNVAVARLVYHTMTLDDPLESAQVGGYINTRTLTCLTYARNFKTIRDVLDWEQKDLAMIRGMGKKALDDIQRLRTHFRYGLRVGRREADHSSRDMLGGQL